MKTFIWILSQKDVKDIFEKCSEWLIFDNFGQELLFATIQSILCGIVAIQALRLKYLWYPQMAIIACVFLML